ncbi:cyclophilin type peptidyl-prolyl cis-trans isomerase [Trypanosoma rangeli SC58]|uniref:Peptidyl-prolyl cis-trans isomerase n=1 Tax=Trypanosoma rangeli SC58 TaxID=429131 RepID=A0A061J9H5_TRYRA|nr:cyclophilin type peptidyl-prolyl cis-trans isomerase [Trypanosoma rangeli SC58]
MGLYSTEFEARVVELHTSEGVISVELYDREAPVLAESFARLAESGQLDGARFARMVPGFVLECAVGVARAYGEVVEVGQENALRHTGAGVVSCPRSAAGGVAAARFFVTLGPQPALDKACVVFGRVYSGMRTIEEISRFRFASDTFRLYSPVEVVRCVVRLLPKRPRPSQSSAAPVAGESHVRQRRERRTSALEELGR